jgi:hypothetical protein
MICADSNGNISNSLVRTDELGNVEVARELEIKSTGPNALVVGGGIVGKGNVEVVGELKIKSTGSNALVVDGDITSKSLKVGTVGSSISSIIVGESGVIKLNPPGPEPTQVTITFPTPLPTNKYYVFCTLRAGNGWHSYIGNILGRATQGFTVAINNTSGLENRTVSVEYMVVMF